MAKKKSGLHKKVSSIFDNVPAPGNGAGTKATQTPGDSPEPLPAAGKPTETTGSGDIPLQKVPEQPPPAESAKPTLAETLSGRGIDTDFAPGAKAILPKGGEYKLFGAIPGISDTRRKVMFVLTPLLFIIMVIVVTNAFTPKSTKKNIRDEFTRKTSTLTDIVQSSAEIKWQSPPPYPEAIRDPMVIPGYKPNQPKPLSRKGKGAFFLNKDGTASVSIVIQSIFHYGKNNRSTVIGDEILYEGDTVGGAKILKINTDSVEFEREDKKFTVDYYE
jgi:hypothetical protein